MEWLWFAGGAAFALVCFFLLMAYATSDVVDEFNCAKEKAAVLQANLDLARDELGLVEMEREFLESALEAGKKRYTQIAKDIKAANFTAQWWKDVALKKHVLLRELKSKLKDIPDDCHGEEEAE